MSLESECQPFARRWPIKKSEYHDMKYSGAVVILLGLWLTYAAWNDPVEGKFLRPAGAILSVAGLFLMLEGFKREIIRSQQERNRNDKDE